MALQTSGAISFADLQTEFGGSNPVSLSEYVRNIGDTSLAGGANEIRYTSIVDGSTFKLGADTAPANLIFQKHQKLILEVTDANMTFSSNKLYFSTSQTLGNNNLITTGVTNNATSTDALMVIDFSNAGFSSSANGTLVGYLKTDLCSNVTAIYLADTPTTNYVQTHVAEAKFELPSNFSGGDYNQKVSTYRDIGATENIAIIPAGGNATMQVTLPGGASGGVWAGGTWSYITINLYDATYNSANGQMTFDNYRQVGWTNNTSYTNGSGNYIGGSGAYSNTASGWASTVASCLNSNSGAPNYQSTSEPVVASASTSGATLTVTITNNGSDRILWHKYQTNQTGTAPDSNNAPSSDLCWSDLFDDEPPKQTNSEKRRHSKEEEQSIDVPLPAHSRHPQDGDSVNEKSVAGGEGEQSLQLVVGHHNIRAEPVEDSPAWKAP